MNRSAQENTWVRRVRLLTQMLILSVTLNIGLCATFAYVVLRESQNPVALELKPALSSSASLELSNEKILKLYATLSFQELVILLENKEFVEDGYMKRDLALACLVAFHHFNLERALGGLSLQQRKMMITDHEQQEELSLAVFPGVADYQYRAILHYARTEKWPLTSQGIFFALKRHEEKEDPNLVDAFSLTPEFYAVFHLFKHAEMRLSKEAMIALVVAGDWHLLAQFTEEQRKQQDLSLDRLRVFLQRYMDAGSRIALHLLFRTDIEYVTKRFSDTHMQILLERLDPKTLGFIEFLKELLLSPRSDAVLEKAGRLLYTLSGEPPPEPYLHALALKRFHPHEEATGVPDIEVIASSPPSLPQPLVVKEKKFHVVEDGDSLWKIARKYNTTIEAIMQYNQLESSRLRVGKKLEIPNA